MLIWVLVRATYPQRGGEICLHDAECYDYELKVNPNKR